MGSGGGGGGGEWSPSDGGGEARQWGMGEGGGVEEEERERERGERRGRKESGDRAKKSGGGWETGCLQLSCGSVGAGPPASVVPTRACVE